MSMFDVSRVSVDVGDSQISFETGKLARQASGAVVVQSGETMVTYDLMGDGAGPLEGKKE